tara:strand:- start:124 stop:534 length:411 start_codon:yes stop_codon:yes gene_type:complete
VLNRSVQGLSPPPPLYQRMISTSQYLGNFPSTKICWPSELWLLEKPSLTKTFRQRPNLIAHYTRQQSGHRLNDEARCNLTSSKHHIADADFIINKMLSDSMINTLIPAAQQTEPLKFAKFKGVSLIECSTTRRQQQ